MLENSLLDFLQNVFGVKNIEHVRAVHLFGTIENHISPIVHHSITSLFDFFVEDDEHDIEYHRLLVIFNNGGTCAFDIDHEGCCEDINEKYLG